MSQNFLNNFYGTLFTPEKTFDELKETQPLLSAVVIVIFISMLNVFLHNDPEIISSPVLYGSALFGSAFLGLTSWLFFAGFFELVAIIFDKGEKYRTLLVLSAYALLPWIFLAPIQMFKMVDSSGQAGGAFIGLLVWLWVIGLQFYAVLKTYELSIGKTTIFILIPLLAWFVFFNWFISFFTTLGKIFGT